MPQIVLKHTAGGWLAAFYVDGKPDAGTVSLFGTNGLPTAFTASADESMVLREIEAANPDASVAVAQ